jgi:tryptophan-rich sensory protein
LILAVMALVATLMNPGREDFAWFLRLRRPAWLSFEGLIPFIWIAIYASFYGSALLSWRASGSWPLMLGYLVLLLLVQSYTLLICRTRSLRNGTMVGFAGWVWGLALTIAVGPVSAPGWLLLVPYLLWSPVGTLVTWQMQRLNR